MHRFTEGLLCNYFNTDIDAYFTWHTNIILKPLVFLSLGKDNVAQGDGCMGFKELKNVSTKWTPVAESISDQPQFHWSLSVWQATDHFLWNNYGLD